MRTVIRGKIPARDVTCWVLQGFVLTSIMLTIYVNNLSRRIKKYLSMYAADAKLGTITTNL